MYNRYIPQPDGSYSRRRMPEDSGTIPAPPGQKIRQREHSAPQAHIPTETKREFSGQSNPNSPPKYRRPQPNTCRQRHQPIQPPPQPETQKPRQDTNVFTFLKQLLPKDFDTGDLLIVLLLLLMSGDCQEDQNTALLTLVLYLFL